jgi:hypothetical protein
MPFSECVVSLFPYFSFFGAYHGLRKVLRLTVAQPAEMNVATAGVITIAPMVMVPSFRPMVPYGVMMIVLDAINGLNDA